MSMAGKRIEIVPTSNLRSQREFFLRVKAPNHRTLLVSETYPSKSNARRAAERLQTEYFNYDIAIEEVEFDGA